MDKLEKIFDDKTFQDPEYYGANFSFPEVSKKKNKNYIDNIFRILRGVEEVGHEIEKLKETPLKNIS